MNVTAIDIEKAVKERYSKGANSVEPKLCCPVDYDPKYLEVLPEEIVVKDYGCGDPSRYLRAGETVLDLGSGVGKGAYIASQVVGPAGSVIGVDMNPDMLSLARRYSQEIGERIGWHNVRFVRGRIQDLSTDLDAMDEWLRSHPIRDSAGLAALDAEQKRMGEQAPLVANDSIDAVVSNCVLNLVSEEEKTKLFPEIYRVLNRGGRAIISDIVADEPVPDYLKTDSDLWSGCISGALTEAGMLGAFEQAGFYGLRTLAWSERPWRTVDGIEFRSVTIEAFKGKDGPCCETNKAVIFRGPWSQVKDDDGHVFVRGVRTAVCEKTFRIMTSEPYADHFVPVLPRVPVDPNEELPFACDQTRPRHPRETKGLDYDVTTSSNGDVCEGPGCC